MPVLKVYNRAIVDARTYPSALARSVHFAISPEGGAFEPLNNNYGILFPKAEISPEDTILERNAAHPRIVRTGGAVYVAVDFTDSTGVNLRPNQVYLWKTTDFQRYDDLGLMDKGALPFDAEAAGDTLTVTVPEMAALLTRFGRPRFSHISCRRPLPGSRCPPWRPSSIPTAPGT